MNLASGDCAGARDYEKRRQNYGQAIFHGDLPLWKNKKSALDCMINLRTGVQKFEN